MDSQNNIAEANTISSKGIRKKVKNAESIALKRYKIDNYTLLDLDKLLNDVYSSFRPVSADYVTRKGLVKRLNAMAIDIYGDIEDSSHPVLEAYGSFVMDMFSPQSDLDVSINFGNGTSELPREEKLQILTLFANKLRSLQGQGHVRNVVSIFSARVPIVKFVDHGSDIECDLSVENKDGILNSQIVHIISQIDGRFQKLCMLIKHWAKAHGVNSALHRTLNSVSITLLVAHHLQTQNPPILPPFSVLFKDGIDLPNVMKRTQKFLNWGERNKESLGRLFVTFFVKLQSVEFLWRQGLCVSLVNGLYISKKWKNKKGTESIRVEDFVDGTQNVARRVNGEGAKKIYGSINRSVEDLFEYLDGKIDGSNLRNRLFGEQAVVVEAPPMPSFSVGIDNNGFNSRRPEEEEERGSKRVRLENGYRAVEGSGYGREERYERNRYGYQESPRFGVYNNPGYQESPRFGTYNNNPGYQEIPRFGTYNNNPGYQEIPRFGTYNIPPLYREVPLNGHLFNDRHVGRFSGEERDPMPVASSWLHYSRRIDELPYDFPQPDFGRPF